MAPRQETEISARELDLKKDMKYVIATRISAIIECIGISLTINYLFEDKYSPRVLIYMLIIRAVLEFVCVALLLYGTLKEVVWALEASIWICIAVGAYTSTLGILGGIYFIRYGDQFLHFFIAALFCCMGFSLLFVALYDTLVIYSWKKSIATT